MTPPLGTPWDRRPPAQQRKAQAVALRSQVVDVVAPFSPWWRERLAALGRAPAQVATLRGLAALPAVGERDVCPDGDPAGAAALVVQAGESGFALHAEGPRLRKALAARLLSPSAYRRVVEADTRPTSFVWAGTGLRYPVASTRSDLDVVARAGARLWQVLGLGRSDVLVGALPLAPSAELQALQLGALASSTPALFPGDDPDAVADALRLVPATVLALPSSGAATALEDLHEAGAELGALRTLLLVGAPTDDERAAVEQALSAVAPPGAVALAVHVPDGHRLAWGECRPGGAAAGLHTYPDLEVVEGVDAGTGEPVPPGNDDVPREVVLTQLGLRGTALLRWRTGDVAAALDVSRCPACRRTVPRVVGVRRRALVTPLALRRGDALVDLRAVGAALAGRGDLTDWRLVLRTGARDGSDQLVLHVAPAAGADLASIAVGVARDVRATTGQLPTQVVVDDAGALPSGGRRLAPRVLDLR